MRRDTVTAIDNDTGVIAIERQLRCTCGCTLDIYTCRTTDFTCTYSPALHKEVVAMVQEGKAPEEIIIFFVEREGEKILMAPVPQGFNLAGYLVPGLGVAAASLALAAYLSRRRGAVAVATAGGASAPATAPDPAAMERLKRALDDVES
jgi:cytochrome c-type biogenesis protein CcmH